ncbi:hypothetical protein [Coraliomargarita akajimensis]|uniref:Uncharacterized protein n=1 Tax=Coraliomargarita akajimensis (strain DSM 45221 / IAM 15411 / JCM 23193 / KCTC 12865 / 04OKA010-24) TaxID=583355 RepID=D5EMA4_CORAD|nr:hypothetical protein [Coraliomargarita akajimensis]ADE55264.1 hypothetical protein Caka_2247 [Coraliomargarita akajimensis DSM 45221]
MKLKTASEFANWVIELRDGALQIQRVFSFESAVTREAFWAGLGRYLKSPSLSTLVESSPEGVLVTIEALPERRILLVAGEIARMCDELYKQELALAA